jgi:hypothetical protein
MTMTPHEALEFLQTWLDDEFRTGESKTYEALAVLRAALEWHTEPPEKSGNYICEIEFGTNQVSVSEEIYDVLCGWSVLAKVTRWTNLPTPPEVH